MINEERNNERKARIAKLRHPGGTMILKERGTEIGVEGQDTLDIFRSIKKGWWGLFSIMGKLGTWGWNMSLKVRTTTLPRLAACKSWW